MNQSGVSPSLGSCRGLWVGAFVVLAGCRAQPNLPQVVVERRTPDGIAIDGVTRLPAPVEVAESSAAVVALKTPLGVDAARETLLRFFQAVAAEDSDGLLRVLSHDAAFVNISNSARDNAFVVWTHRFAKLDYRAVVPENVVARENLTFKRSQDAGGPDLIMLVRLSSSTSSELFGEMLVVRLRRHQGNYVISEFEEMFQMP